MTGLSAPFPEGGARSDRRIWIKLLAVAGLAAGLALVAFVAVRYVQTGKPIAEIAPRVPAPIVEIIEEQPRYMGSVWDLNRPRGIATGADGTLFVAESDGDRTVLMMDAEGNRLGTLMPDIEMRDPLYLEIGPGGQVYVSDLRTRTIYIFDPATAELVGEVTSPFEGGWVPEALTFDAAGNLYVTDATPGSHRVVVLDPDGALVREFGTEGEGDGQFSFPNGIAVDARGRIFVSDTGNGRVLVYDRDFELLATLGRGTGPGDFAMPRGVVIDEERDLLLVVDTTDHDVKVFDISDDVPEFKYSLGAVTGPGELRFPTDVALDGSGQIFVTDRENHRVSVWRY